MTEIDYGWLIRSIHSWIAEPARSACSSARLDHLHHAGLPPAAGIHLDDGPALLGIFLAFGFSGYLLPWNQLAFFATRVGTAIAGLGAGDRQVTAAVARGGEKSPATRWPASMRCTW